MNISDQTLDHTFSVMPLSEIIIKVSTSLSDSVLSYAIACSTES